MFFLIFPFHKELLPLFKANPIRNCSLRNVLSLSDIFSVSLFFSKCLSCLLCVPISRHFSFSSFCVSVIYFSLVTCLCFYICLYPPLLLTLCNLSLSIQLYEELSYTTILLHFFICKLMVFDSLISKTF